MKKKTRFTAYLIFFIVSSIIMVPGSVIGAGDGTLKWQSAIKNPSSPAIGPDGTIYVGSTDYYLYAFNPDGTQKWAFKTGDYVHSPVIGPTGVIYVSSEDSVVYAINPDGSPRWTYDTGGLPLIAKALAIGTDGTIYVNASDMNYDRIIALNPNGTKKWDYERTKNMSSGGGSSPVIAGDIIYAPSTEGLAAIKLDGTLKWFFYHSGGVFGDLAIAADGTIFMTDMNKNLLAVDPSGVIKWTLQFNGDLVLESSPSIGPDGTIYLGGPDKYFYAINPDGTIKWRYRAGIIMRITPPVGADGTIYLPCNSSEQGVYAFNPDGTVKWWLPTSVGGTSDPVIGKDGTIYLGSCYFLAINTTCGGLAKSPWPMFHHDVSHTGRANAAILTDQDQVKVPRGRTATLQVKLSENPQTDVLVTVAWQSGTPALSIQGGATLTFTPANWNAYQTIQLFATRDPNGMNATAVFRLSGDGLTGKQVTAMKTNAGGIGHILNFFLEKQQ